MQGDIVTDEDTIQEMRSVWLDSAMSAAEEAENMADSGVHKQIVNRILMPYLYTDTVVTATEWENFYQLRLDEAAEPHINQLANKMLDAHGYSVPKETMYHAPYVELDKTEDFEYLSSRMMISAARRARVSYTLFDGSTSEEKDLELAEKLYTSRHMSPFEHQAFVSSYKNTSHFRNFSAPWSQFRATVEDMLGG